MGQREKLNASGWTERMVASGAVSLMVSAAFRIICC